MHISFSPAVSVCCLNACTHLSPASKLLSGPKLLIGPTSSRYLYLLRKDIPFFPPKTPQKGILRGWYVMTHNEGPPQKLSAKTTKDIWRGGGGISVFHLQAEKEVERLNGKYSVHFADLRQFQTFDKYAIKAPWWQFVSQRPKQCNCQMEFYVLKAAWAQKPHIVLFSIGILNVGRILDLSMPLCLYVIFSGFWLSQPVRPTFLSPYKTNRRFYVLLRHTNICLIRSVASIFRAKAVLIFLSEWQAVTHKPHPPPLELVASRSFSKNNSYSTAWVWVRGGEGAKMKKCDWRRKPQF